MLGLSVLLQAGALVIAPPSPTVGDTITVIRTIEAAADVRARAQPLGSSTMVEPLADPVVGRSPDGITVRYSFAMFESGRHPVGVPPVEMLYRDGRVELVPGDTAWVTVRSVLPGRDPPPEPVGSLGPIARHPTRTLPLLALVGSVLLVGSVWAVARRRVGAREMGSAPPGRPATAPLTRWVAAGEGRAVAAVAADRLRDRIARLVPRADRALSAEECIRVLEEERPDLPLRDVADTLRALERARFAPAVPSDVALVVDQVDVLLKAL